MLDNDLYDAAFGESDLDRAFDRDQFELWFQPQYDLATRRIQACEGMVRWRHPDLGLLPPGLFLKSVQAQDRMADLTHCVIALGGQALKRWRDDGRNWRLNLNISASDLLSSGFSLLAEAEIEAAGAAPSDITFEIREDAFVQAGDAAIQAAKALRRAGFGLAMEARGARIGEEDLIAEGIFTEFKLTGPTLLRMGAVQQRAGGGLAGTRLDEAKRASLPAVAVGVENETLCQALRDMGFDQAQGHALARPAPLRDILKLEKKPEPGKDSLSRVFLETGQDMESLIAEARKRTLNAEKTEAA